jgi:hypothetical protein
MPMNIKEWNYTKKDIAKYPKGVKSQKESVLANAVNAANYDLLESISSGDRVLEIGCGSSSFLRDHMQIQSNWEGIDVFSIDSRGRECIATKLGSVHEIPFANDSFDIILSNQSIEHWFEYGVSISDGLKEITRVLKVDGVAHLNFPFFLHGHPLFVKGDLTSILELVDQDSLKVDDLIAFEDSEESDYPGWRRCGFPDFYIKRHSSTPTSFVVEVVLKKISNSNDAEVINSEFREMHLPSRLSSTRRVMFHGVDILIWKVGKKIISKFFS